MTVTEAYTSRPTVGAFSGSLPLSAGATVWLDGTDLSSSWVPADGIANKGTAGSALNATLVTSNPKPAGGASVIDSSDISRITGGVQILDEGVEQNTAASFKLPDSAVVKIDASESALWTLDFTSLFDSQFTTIKWFDFYEGPNIPKFDGPETATGGVFEYVPTSGGLTCAVNDNTLPFGVAPAIDFALVPSMPSPPTVVENQRVRVSLKIDRVNGVMSLWVDGELWVDGATDAEVAIDDMTLFSVFDFGGGPTNMRSIAATAPLGTLSGTYTAFLGNLMVFHHLQLHPSGTDAYSDPGALHDELGA